MARRRRPPHTRQIDGGARRRSIRQSLRHPRPRSRPGQARPEFRQRATWFGYVSVWTCALAAAKANSLKPLDMAKALQDYHLPPEIALGPNPAFYRAGQNQLIASLFVGEAQAGGSAPDDLFKVTRVVNGADIAGTVEQSGCKMPWPT